MRTVTIVLHATTVPGADFAAAVAACQKQLTEHFAPAWGGLAAQLAPVTSAVSTPVKPTGETVYVVDDADQAGALGYHELAGGDVPVAFVFARTCQQAGVSWSSCLSHELLEQVADPFCETCVVVNSFLGRPAALAYEVADPVEDDTYTIDGVAVSNFVLPAWFQDRKPAAGVTAKGPFDYLKKLSAPLTMTKGGYVSYTTDLKHWRQDTAHAKAHSPRRYHRPAKDLRDA